VTSVPIPSPGMTASFNEPEDSVDDWGMPAMLVVVRALPAVVSQVKRRLDGLAAAGAVGVVLGRSPLGVHVVHRAVS
jgi:hypothetical protein